MSATLLPPAPDSIVPARSRRPARILLLKVLLAAAVVLIAASCTGRHPVPTSYGKADSSVEKNFVKGCVSTVPGDTAAAKDKVCRCAYVNVKATIPFADFKKVNSDLSKRPAALPDTFQRIIAGCVSSGGSTTSTTKA